MADLLELAANLPIVELAADDVLITEDTRTGSVWVLIEGQLEVRKHGAPINVIDRPGAAFGEVALLTDAEHSASVVALGPSRLHYAEDGRALLLDRPEILLDIAAGLAERLSIVTSYLADLRNQYADAPGLNMVSNVLGRLVEPNSARPQPGSAREPNPEY